MAVKKLNFNNILVLPARLSHNIGFHKLLKQAYNFFSYRTEKSDTIIKKSRRKDSSEQCSGCAVPCQQKHDTFISCRHIFIFFLQLNFSVIAFLIRYSFLNSYLYSLLMRLCIAFCLFCFFVLKFPCHDFCVGSFPAGCLAG